MNKDEIVGELRELGRAIRKTNALLKLIYERLESPGSSRPNLGRLDADDLRSLLGDLS